MEDTGWGGFPRGNGINNGVAGSSAMVVEAQTLEAPTDYGFERSGKQLNGTQGFQWAFREFAAENRLDMDSGKTVYFSYLFSMRNLSESLGSYAELLFINADRTDLFRVGVQVASFVPTIAQGNNTLWAAGSRQIQPDTSYLLVGRIITGAEDTISIQLYEATDTIGAEPEVWEVETVQEISLAQVDRIGLISGGMDNGIDHTAIYDELRFGESFAAVTGVEENTAPESWAGFPFLDNSGDVHTDNLLGRLNVTLEPWVWSYVLERYVFTSESAVTETGAWVYFHR